jgi:hypothetical protein
MTEEIERDYYALPNSSANGLELILRKIDGQRGDDTIRYVWVGNRPLAELQVKRTRLDTGEVVEDVLLIPGPDTSSEP